MVRNNILMISIMLFSGLVSFAQSDSLIRYMNFDGEIQELIENGELKYDEDAILSKDYLEMDNRALSLMNSSSPFVIVNNNSFRLSEFTLSFWAFLPTPYDISEPIQSLFSICQTEEYTSEISSDNEMLSLFSGNTGTLYRAGAITEETPSALFGWAKFYDSNSTWQWPNFSYYDEYIWGFDTVITGWNHFVFSYSYTKREDDKIDNILSTFLNGKEHYIDRFMSDTNATFNSDIIFGFPFLNSWREADKANIMLDEIKLFNKALEYRVLESLYQVNTSSILNPMIQQLQIFPSVVENEINIVKNNDLGDLLINVFAPNGKCIYQGILRDSATKIIVSELNLRSSGIYLLRIYDKKGVFMTKKVIKK